jgi:hypothetical protein
MLPVNTLGNDTHERAAIHESGHAVVGSLLGGTLSQLILDVIYKDATWSGGCNFDPPLQSKDEVLCRFAGPLSEALYVANVHDHQHSWKLSPGNLQHHLLQWPSAALLKNVVFNAGGQPKTLQLLRGMFSDDWDLALDLCNQKHFAFPDILATAIGYVNTDEIWNKICSLANDLLKLPPKITRFEPNLSTYSDRIRKDLPNVLQTEKT